MAKAVWNLVESDRDYKRYVNASSSAKLQSKFEDFRNGVVRYHDKAGKLAKLDLLKA